MSEDRDQPPVDDPAGSDELQPNTQHATRECFIWVELMEQYAENARGNARKADAEGNVPLAVEYLKAVDDWMFRARSLRRAADICLSIAPYEAKVRDTIRACRAAEARKAGKGKPAAAEGAPA